MSLERRQQWFRARGVIPGRSFSAERTVLAVPFRMQGLKGETRLPFCVAICRHCWKLTMASRKLERCWSLSTLAFPPERFPTL